MPEPLRKLFLSVMIEMNGPKCRLSNFGGGRGDHDYVDYIDSDEHHDVERVLVIMITKYKLLLSLIWCDKLVVPTPPGFYNFPMCSTVSQTTDSSTSSSPTPPARQDKSYLPFCCMSTVP